jgi:replication factor C subunit 1
VQLDLKTNGNGSSAKKAPAKSKASGSAGKAVGGSAGKRKR